jgi:23S rRNA (guanine1835-N2)-methyltransferase
MNHMNTHISRYPNDHHPSLKAWNAADEYLLDFWKNLRANRQQYCFLCHDRFGFLHVNAAGSQPQSVALYASQMKAIELNCQRNNIGTGMLINTFQKPAHPASVAMLKIPKSLDLFDHYLHWICTHSQKEVQIYAGFMTRHFTETLLSIARKYFHTVEQSLARKKARVLILKVKKELSDAPPAYQEYEFHGTRYRQWAGVFSASGPDMASRFLLDHFTARVSERSILDLGCGNGLLAAELHKRHEYSDIYLMDDFLPAVESARLNLSEPNVQYIWDDGSQEIPPVDLVVCNPPFHVEYETDLHLPLRLFSYAHRCLKPGGRMVIVANTHLNYSLQLTAIFCHCVRIASNQKFEILEAVKG